MSVDTSNSSAYNPSINDYVESSNPYENFFERYLHLNGFGRKFKLLKGKVNETGSYREVKDHLSFSKIIGNILRIASYILFPLPLIALALRERQRKERVVNIKLEINPKTFEQKKYVDLAAENIVAPCVSTETYENRIVYHLANLTSDLTHENYEGLVRYLKEYPEIAPNVLEDFVSTLTEKGIVRGIYEIHLMTIMYLKSDEGDDFIPISTKQKLLEKLTNFLKNKTNLSGDTDAKAIKDVIYNFLASIKPKILTSIDNEPTFVNKSASAKEKDFAKKIAEVVWELNPNFWENHANSIEEISNDWEKSSQIKYRSVEAWPYHVENAQIFLPLIKSKIAQKQVPSTAIINKLTSMIENKIGDGKTNVKVFIDLNHNERILGDDLDIEKNIHDQIQNLWDKSLSSVSVNENITVSCGIVYGLEHKVDLFDFQGFNFSSKDWSTLNSEFNLEIANLEGASSARINEYFPELLINADI